MFHATFRALLDFLLQNNEYVSVYLTTAFGEFESQPIVLNAKDFSADSIQVIFCSLDEELLNDDGIIVHGFVASLPISG